VARRFQGRRVKTAFVVNPRSNGGATGRTLGALRDVVRRRLGGVLFFETTCAGDGRRLAREAVTEGFERVVAVGGDGTFSEVVDGVVASGVDVGAVTVGLVHQGTGGDFRRLLGVEHRLASYLDVIDRGRTTRLDVGRLTTRTPENEPKSRHFVNVASVGMGGLVVKDVSKPGRLLGGSALYLAASVGALVRGTAARLVATAETESGPERFELTTRILAISNGRYFGGGMELAPHAKTDDGWFDVLWVEGSARLPMLPVLAGVYDGSHLKQAGVRRRRVRSLTLEPVGAFDGDTFLVDADGEQAGTLPLALELLPGRVSFLS